MENTGKTSAYSSMTDHCKACDSLMADVRKFYSHGGYIRWGGLTVLSVTVNGRAQHGGVTYDVKVDSRPTHYQETADGELRQIEGGITNELVTLKRTGQTFQVTGRARLAT
ncbi:hypothetical protein [Nocardioides cynanchi]|uniref:hypothetical protein n=1 Tax=Nocardioides cynanchi TaxID=2558918 RepID=UPI001782AAA9|nr:hypothetical protein [Nocardioides cynanchi]